jgi:adenosylmethionine---8-amino-7-oxononanoate aminotransferase
MQDSLLQRSLKSVWHPCTQMRQHDTGELPLLSIAHGKGAWLYDTDGRRYLDGISSWWVNLFGHCDPRINAALKDQLERLEHVILAGATHEPVVALAERLSALAGNELGHCFYASDGASATEIALKMSAHYWRNSGRPTKNSFLCLAGGYHGETVGALGVTDIPIFRDAYAPLLRAAAVLPSPDARGAANPLAAARHAAAALEAHLDEHHDRVAALIVEPLVQCAASMAMHDPEYLRLARALCDRHQVHLICDEIAVGCGRTGTFFAHEQANIRPDFLCLSKGITGGYLPLSVVMTTDMVYQAFYDDATARGFLHSHSYTGNPLACRAALATLDIFAQDRVLTVNVARSARIDALLQPLAEHPRVRHYRRRGMIFAFDVDADPGFGRRFHRAALAREALLRPIGNTVYLMPPYIIDDAETEQICHVVATALEEALAP